jgi:hypothetical protein
MACVLSGVNREETPGENFLRNHWFFGLFHEQLALLSSESRIFVILSASPVTLRQSFVQPRWWGRMKFPGSTKNNVRHSFSVSSNISHWFIECIELLHDIHVDRFIEDQEFVDIADVALA